MPTLKRVRELNDRTPTANDYLLTDPASGPWGRSTVRSVVNSAAYTHTQSSAASTWTINHNLGYNPIVQVFTSGGVEVIADVVHTSPNQTVIYFSAPTSGFARMI